METIFLKERVIDQHLFQKIQGLDLSEIEKYLMVKKGWSELKTKNAIQGYHQYLYLVEKVGNISPPQEIDDVWHRHILHTKQYEIDCRNIFGRFIHHEPFPVSVAIGNECTGEGGDGNCKGSCNSCGDPTCSGSTNCQDSGGSGSARTKVISFQSICEEFFGTPWVSVN